MKRRTKNFSYLKDAISKRLLLSNHPDKKDLKQYLKELLGIKNYLKNIYVSSDLISDLQRARVLQINCEIDKVINLIQSLKNLFDVNFKRYQLRLMLDSINKMEVYLTEPLSFFPNVSLWLLSDKEPIGICTVETSDIIWSKYDKERGLICNKMVYTDIKTLNLKDFKNPYLENLARIKTYFWMGLSKDTEHIFDGFCEDGYGVSHKFVNEYKLPNYIFYTGRNFEFNYMLLILNKKILNLI